jgi:hypothetical protein
MSLPAKDLAKSKCHSFDPPRNSDPVSSGLRRDKLVADGIGAIVAGFTE